MQTKISTPLRVQLSFQIERPLFVGEVTRRDNKTQTNPEEDVVDGQERSVVENDAGKADEGGEDS